MNDNTIFGDDLLETPVWIMIINVIALEMLHKNLNSSESFFYSFHDKPFT